VPDRDLKSSVSNSRERELKSINKSLVKIDSAFASATKTLPPCTFGVNAPTHTHYQSLVHSVFAQQVSKQAALTIGERLKYKCNGRITPKRVGQLSLPDLQSIGLTRAKVRTIDELTRCAMAGGINFRKIPYMENEEIIQELIPLYGLGRWTAEMFLIFQLGRLDVWPVDDLAVRRGWDRLHNNTVPIKAKDLRDEGDRFLGMRSVVAWYCWRSS
jgi:DNA-3-methyladenine glycosylase II